MLLSSESNAFSAVLGEGGIFVFGLMGRGVCEGLTPRGRGQAGGLSEYARLVGKQKQHISSYRNGAEVLDAINSNIDVTLYLDKAQHLAAIHGAPLATPFQQASGEVRSFTLVIIVRVARPEN